MFSGGNMNIFVYNVHTPFFYTLSSIGHKWYSPVSWDAGQRPKPKNFYDVAEEEVDTLIKKGCFDIQILSTPQQFNNRRRNLPTIYIEHNTQELIRPHDVTDSNVVVMWGERAAKTWIKRLGFTYIIYPRFIKYNARDYVGDDKVVLTVCNEFKQRNWCCGHSKWEEVSKSFPRMVVGIKNEALGENVGFKDFGRLREIYSHSRVYFDTRICWNTTAAQEAILTGMPFICTDADAPLENEEEIIKSKNPEYLKQRIIELLDDVDKCKALGERGRKALLKQFSFEDFKSAWCEGLEKAVEKYDKT